jgi:hypothetical protein
MKFQKIEDTLAVCAAHLDAAGARGTPIENLLVSHVLILICCEYELLLPRRTLRKSRSCWSYPRIRSSAKTPSNNPAAYGRLFQVKLGHYQRTRKLD